MCLSPPKIDTPPAPDTSKTLTERKARVRSAAEKQRQLAAAGGLQSTILTGPGAAQSGGGKTLLGQ